MNKCNLLPWRECLLTRQRKIFICGFHIAVLIPLITLFVVNKIVVNHYEVLLKDNEILSEKIRKFTTELQEYKIREQDYQQLNIVKENVKKIQDQRQQIVHLLAILPKIIPSHIYFTTIIFENNEVILIGKAITHTAVAEFMRQLEQLPGIRTVKLNNLHNETGQLKETNFQFTIFLKPSIPNEK